ncbi:MAG TPA: cupin-like domain-containing protein [Steroidobacteraceae bacterium]
MTAPATFQRILVRHGVDLKTFNDEIRAAREPVVLKDAVAHWPIVAAGRESPRALADYIRRFDRGSPIPIIEIPASQGGRMFYRDDMSGFNFERSFAGLGATLDRLLALAGEPEPVTLFIESLRTEQHLADFPAAHPMPLLPPSVLPRLWVGNRVTVQTHFDLLENIACVVGGRRRFTLFPPEQIANLYMGPVEFTPAGTPVSMVPLRNPDPARYPRFAQALTHARQVELEPGDALYIPYAWWHHVESLTPFNALVNYWWNDTKSSGSPYGTLLHAAMSLRDMPPDQRMVWRAFFDHLVFTDPETALAHLTPEQRGLLGPPTPKRVREVRDILAMAFPPSPGKPPRS